MVIEPVDQAGRAISLAKRQNDHSPAARTPPVRRSDDDAHFAARRSSSTPAFAGGRTDRRDRIGHGHGQGHCKSDGTDHSGQQSIGLSRLALRLGVARGAGLSRAAQGNEMTARVLIVDDDTAIRCLLRRALEGAGEIPLEAADAAEALSLARSAGIEVVLLDLGLPDREGLELVPLIKAMDRAVIVLTARDETTEKVTALDLGADDYVTKPFDTVELLARVRVALRRRSGWSNALLTLGGVEYDPASRRVTRDGAQIHLTRKEYALFAELARYPGRVITHGALLSAIWGPAHVDDVEYLRVTMRGLRAKLEANPARPRLLVNDPGIGYRLTPTDTRL